MKKTQSLRILSAVFILFLLWEVVSLATNNDWLMPYPVEVLKRMASQVASVAFYEAIANTLTRAVLGLSVAFILALLCAFLSYRHKVFKDLFYPLLLLTRSIPNISYIIIILVWFGRESSAAIIGFLILFPTIYTSIYQGFVHIDTHLLQVIQMYPEKTTYQIRRVYLPLLRGSIEASLANGISLAFKVGVMAEIIGQVSNGVGRQLNLCRLQFDMTGIFAWTGWIIFLLVILEGIVRVCYQEK